ncbi:potassium channel family protein [Tundrisphaera sp. TA3]|uniref:potassium channel family protein n=1 Tax=Tundrisphaera sp. TA3 TaxID=3435775 RepID=UPI003EB6AB0A
MKRSRKSRVPSVEQLRAALSQPDLAHKVWAAIRRNQVLRLMAAMSILWILGAIGIGLAEGKDNPDFNTWTESFWNVWVMLFSGLENPPQTAIGRLISMLLLGLGVGLVGLFTGSVASILIDQNMRRNEVANFEMDDHLVLCNWGPRGLEWIREVHSKIIQDKRPVVIIHDSPEEIDLPDKQDDAAFNDVYIVKGDPTNEVILRRARVPKAHSVVILSDARQGEHTDGKTILTCIAIRNICRGEAVPNVSVECHNVNNRHHLMKAGADEIISSDELGLRLLARSALFHGMTQVYQELLTVGRDANEMYLYPIPKSLVGRDFAEIASMFVRNRDDKRSCLLIGIQRGDEMNLNPVGKESGPLAKGDQLILLSRVFLSRNQPLPTIPPIEPDPEE